MKKVFVCLIPLILVVFGCEQGVHTPRMPDYLMVYEQYKNTPEAKACEDYRKEVMDKEHHPDNHTLKAYKAENDLDIAHATFENGIYNVHLTCSITATYQVRSNQHLTATFEKDLGNMSFILEHDEENKIQRFDRQ